VPVGERIHSRSKPDAAGQTDVGLLLTAVETATDLQNTHSAFTQLFSPQMSNN